MNREDVNWLLKTIKEPGDVKRFLKAQYERGRISLQLMNEVAPADVTPKRDRTDRITSPLLTMAMVQSAEHSAMALLLATAW